MLTYFQATASVIAGGSDGTGAMTSAKVFIHVIEIVTTIQIKHYHKNHRNDPHDLHELIISLSDLSGRIFSIIGIPFGFSHTLGKAYFRGRMT